MPPQILEPNIVNNNSFTSATIDPNNYAEKVFNDAIAKIMVCRDSMCSCEELIGVYRNGLLANEHDQKNNIKIQNNYRYISEEEKYYALRWNGHQPLVPMPDVSSKPLTDRKKATIDECEIFCEE